LYLLVTETHSIRDTAGLQGKNRAVVIVTEMAPVTGSRKTMSVPEAGREYYGIGKNASYEAAKRGDIPTIRIGRLLRVPIVAMERKLDLAGAGEAK